MALAYLQIFRDAAEYINLLDDAQRGRILTAMMAYAFDDDVPEFESGMEKMAWIALRRMIDQSKASLEGKRAGGRARQQTPADIKQTSAEGQQESAECQRAAAETSNIKELRIKTQDTRDKKQINGEDKRARARFTPPTVEEVRAYCAESGLSIDPERFTDYYESNGWMVGRNHMKDWRAAARSWAQRDPPTQPPRTQGKVVREQQYTQREYVHNYDALDWLMSQPLKDDHEGGSI